MKNRCVVCGSYGAELHHWRTRASGGKDEYFNLMPLCRIEHQEVHRIGSISFSNKYSKVRNWLISNGWEYNEVIKKWRHE